MATLVQTQPRSQAPAQASQSPGQVNGINLAPIVKLVGDVKASAAAGNTHWGVTTRWAGGTVTETQVTGCDFGARHIARSFKFRTDEPLELGGTNLWANPQEYLLGALNACMTVGYVALAALQGIKLESVEIETQGDLDLRGFFDLDSSVKPGYDELRYVVRIKGDATPEQLRAIHETVIRTSPNRFNISQSVRLNSELVIG